MSMEHPANFQQDLADEQDDTRRKEVRIILRHLFPDASGMTIERDRNQQFAGVDVLINVKHGPPISLDFKFRKEQYDDFALEYAHEHDNGSKSLGWVADQHKQCDLIAYVFKPTWQCYLLPRPALQAAWQRFGNEWLAAYRLAHHKTRNVGYWTLWCPVPNEILLREVAGVRVGDLYKAAVVERDTPLLEHYCRCGQWGTYSFGLSALYGKTGTSYCLKHRPLKDQYDRRSGKANSSEVREQDPGNTPVIRTRGGNPSDSHRSHDAEPAQRTLPGFD